MRSFRILGSLAGLALCFAVGFSWRNLRDGELPSASTMAALVTGRANRSEQSAEDIFKQAYNHVESEYYKPIVPKDLKYAGMEGMLSSLGDPHTLFLPPKDAKEFDMDTEGNFVGIGARLGRDALGAKMVVVFDDGPAKAAGLKGGDVITAVDGKSVVGIPVDDIVTRIRGQEGSNVVLTIINPDNGKRKNFTIRRAKIVMPTAEGEYFKDSGIGYLSVIQFAETTTEQFDKELDKLDEDNIKGLVIDLRGNPGGLLETAVDMLSRFVDDKTVVKMKMRDEHEETAKTESGLVRTFHYPIVLLINEDSASAAEIFAGVLHDYRLVTLVGTHSYGKASVQNVFKLRDGSSAKITIARYYLPNGEDIGRKVDQDGQYVSGGLEPDVKVDIDPDDSSITLGDVKTDTQLQKAIEVIKGKL